jgi:hypothetical protein
MGAHLADGARDAGAVSLELAPRCIALGDEITRDAVDE